MRITIITIGSYGDVQPYIALGLGLQAVGHKVRLATHATFKPFICSQGLSFFPIEGDPPNLLKTETGRAWLEAGGNPILFFHRLSRIVEPLLQQSIIDCWNACQNVDAIVFSQLGICIAYPIVENLEVPFCLANTIPLTPTRAFACPFFPSAPTWLPSDFYNRSTYFLTVQALWKLVQPAMNRVRRELLNLPPLPSRWLVDRLRQQRIHFLYGYSPSFLPQPPDWNGWNHITGYWFLPRPSNWYPPANLVDFLASGPPPVYVGFGSMNNRNPEEVTEMVLKALARCRKRGVLLMGWDGLSDIDMPDDVFKIDSIPHDWLFPQMAAVVHHGGAYTTAAGLRAGIPSIAVPFFADQPFWGQQISKLGVGPKPIPRKRLSEERLAAAILAATNDKSFSANARVVGERIHAEDGIAQAIKVLHTCLF